MKEELKYILSEVDDNNMARMILREYLQAKILKFMQDMGLFHKIAFLGGTALRFLYSLNRFSEELDFSVISDEKPDFMKIMQKIDDKLELETYDINYKIKENGNIHSCLLKFKGLLHELNLSAHEKEILSIKIEVDYNPPKNFKTETSVIRKYFLLNIKHYDLSTLFAGKLNAIFTRGYTKGRDIYDLFWYLTSKEKILPNFEFLNNALSQFDYSTKISNKNWKTILKDKIEKVSWAHITKELEFFLEDPAELEIITKENLIKLISTF